MVYSIFKVFGMTRPGIEPRSPGSLANTLPIRPTLLLIILFQFNNSHLFENSYMVLSKYL